MVLEKAYPYTPKPIRIKYDGDFSVDEFYNTIFKWFNKHRFKWSEKRFKEKPSSFKGSEFKINLYGDRKKTEYYKYVLDIYAHLLEYYERDTIVNGKKVKMGNGKIDLTINGHIISDYKSKFPTGKQKTLIGKFYAFLGQILLEIRKNEVLLQEVEYLDPLMQELATDIRNSLKMESNT